MRLCEFSETRNDFVDMFHKFLPLAVEVLELDSLPQFVFDKELDTGSQPSFGMYDVDNKILYVALANRHPVDILRTIAHELVHYRQDLNNELEDDSGMTGSPHENQANELAGVILRHFNKQNPEFLKIKPLLLEASLFDPVPGKINTGDFVTFDGSSETWKVIAVNLDRTQAKIKSQDSGMVTKFSTDKLKKVQPPELEEQYDQEAEEYRAKLIKQMPYMMKFLDQAVKGWRPNEEQIMAAIETAYTVMKHTGNIKQAGKAMMDELNTLHRISQDQQSVAEAMARNAKEKKLFELLETWGFFISFKTVDLGKTNAVDQTAKQEILKMRQHYLGPVLNGMTFGEITKGDLWQNPKVIPHLLKYIYQGIPYIEERIKKFIVSNEQQRYLSTIDKIKTLYKEVVAQYSGQQGVVENFADGRNPQDKGDSARHGIRKGMSIAQLKKIRSSNSASPRKKQLAHWQINMRQGRKK